MTINVELMIRGQTPQVEASIAADPEIALAGGAVRVATTDYESLSNKPRIEGTELVGDRPMTDFISFGGELTYASRTLDVDVMTAQQVANLLTDD